MCHGHVWLRALPVERVRCPASGEGEVPCFLLGCLLLLPSHRLVPDPFQLPDGAYPCPGWTGHTGSSSLDEEGVE